MTRVRDRAGGPGRGLGRGGHRRRGGPRLDQGMIMAAGPVGFVIGGLAVGRLVAPGACGTG